MSIDRSPKSPRGLTVGIVGLLACWLPCVPGMALACTPQPAAASRTLVEGLWGGDHIRMVAGRTSAQLEYDCATGTIDEPIVLDASGRFTATGSHTPEHGGPQRDGQAAGVRAQ